MTKNLLRTAAAAAAATAAIALSGPASAQSDVKVAWNVGVVSDYIFRGVSQTGEDPAIQGGVDLTSGSFYAGAWASNVDFGDKTDAEIDVYGGYRTEAAGFAWDFGVIGYLYAGEPKGADYNYAEFKAAASRAVGPATFGAAVYYSPDFYGVDKEATYAEINGAFAPAPKWTVSGAVGRQWLNVSKDYNTWNLGVGYALTDNLGIDVRYYDTNVKNTPAADDRIVGGLKLTF
ncbi:MAG: TorF family putative porin [Candidatus Brevundimonas colombiensis]|jgi:uncharacterized protein (TIGR02001 family)|uniref:TorF family putative porin n=1 Tax=Candidatus Brevundimonas colombiensis TaxID=3121376 RepID=A0AAJ5X335_9CAUL|nr:TorF family putative porin [Brevundimonas sp.]WEK40202.1 MAG: TorF family putative porin [Brevundimonas sp.]